MSKDRFGAGGSSILGWLGDMLGLEEESLIWALKEAIQVPGGIDEIADLIIQNVSFADQIRLARELPEEPEVFALLGRLLVALQRHPGSFSLRTLVLARARRLGEPALQHLSPRSWYPDTEQIRTVWVSPDRLSSPFMMMRMQWGGEFEGLEALWLLRFGEGERSDAYFVAGDDETNRFAEMPWMELSLPQALSLIASTVLVQSAVEGAIAFDSMVGLGLWMALGGNGDVPPWVEGLHELQAQPLDAADTARMEFHALNAKDYLAAHSVLDPRLRPTELLSAIRCGRRQEEERGELWRLDSVLEEVADGQAVVHVEAWYKQAGDVVRCRYEVRLHRVDEGPWLIWQLEVLGEEGVDIRQVERYLERHPRYWAQLNVLDLQELARVLSATVKSGNPSGLHFGSDSTLDYRLAFDIGSHAPLHWTVVPGEEARLLVWARDELLLRREVVRLQEEGAVGEMLRSGMMDLVQVRQAQTAVDERAVERLASLLALTGRH